MGKINEGGCPVCIFSDSHGHCLIGKDIPENYSFNKTSKVLKCDK